MKVVTANIIDKRLVIKEAVGLEKPLAVVYNYNGFGYGVFPLGGINLNYISSLKDEMARASAYSNLYENMLIGNISPDDAFRCYFRGIQLEENELVLRIISNNMNSIYWKFLQISNRRSVKKC